MGVVSAVGVVLQGVFVLDLESAPTALIHWLGALMFIVGAQGHAQEIVSLYAQTAAGPLRRLLRRWTERGRGGGGTLVGKRVGEGALVTSFVSVLYLPRLLFLVILHLFVVFSPALLRFSSPDL